MAELIVVDETHPQQIVPFDRCFMHFDKSFQQIYSFTVLIIFIQLFCLLNRRVLLIANSAGPSFMQTGLDAGIVVLGEGGARLSVEQVPRRILFDELARPDFMRGFVQTVAIFAGQFLLLS